MFQGANVSIANRELRPICDIGGNRVLGMGGSLWGYINTGNQYNKDYFVKQKNKKGSNKTKTNILKFLKPAAIIAGLAAGVIALKKHGKFSLPKIFNKAQRETSEEALSFLDKIKQGFSKFKNKINKGNVVNDAAQEAADTAQKKKPAIRRTRKLRKK